MEEMFARQTQRSIGTGEPVSLVLLDLDYFKSVNDTYGHPAGDRLLQHFSSLARATFRPTDLQVRYGGEEFCVLLPGAGAARAASAAERLLVAVRAAPLELGGGESVAFTASAGVAEHVPNEPIATLIERADSADNPPATPLPACAPREARAAA